MLFVVLQPGKVVVTGAAGFIGSHLCERLLSDGHEVVGVDNFADYYDRSSKERNLETASAHESFALEEVDIAEGDLKPVLRDATVVFHLAGQPGVRPSWGPHFDRYVHDNILATQRLLEALRDVELNRFVFASSSSVYGNAHMVPTKESSVPKPISPYGMTKLAAEQLAFVYMRNFGLPATVLRYFTVYGPRQRPDMAIHRFMDALLDDREIEILGDGEQTREFTYISDAVDATVRTASADVVGQVVNIGGGSRVTINRVIDTLEEVSGKKARRKHMPAALGDPRHEGASINEARDRLTWEPRVSLREGLTRQWAWFQGAKNASPSGSRPTPR